MTNSESRGQAAGRRNQEDNNLLLAVEELAGIAADSVNIVLRRKPSHSILGDYRIKRYIPTIMRKRLDLLLRKAKS